MSEEIKPVFYVDGTTLRCRTMDDISDESVLHYRRGDKIRDTDVALYPESAIESMKENRNRLVVAIHSLASNFENILGVLANDEEALTKAKGDIAHAMKVAKDNRG